MDAFAQRALPPPIPDSLCAEGAGTADSLVPRAVGPCQPLSAGCLIISTILFKASIASILQMRKPRPRVSVSRWKPYSYNGVWVPTRGAQLSSPSLSPSLPALLSSHEHGTQASLEGSGLTGRDFVRPDLHQPQTDSPDKHALSRGCGLV